MDNFDFTNLLNDFHINESQDYTNKDNLKKLVKDAMQFAYSKAFKDTIKQKDEKLNKYETQELETKLKSHVKSDFIKDFIKLHDIKNDMSEADIKKILKENPRFMNTSDSKPTTTENGVVKTIMSNRKDKEGYISDFNVDDPMGFNS